MTLLSDVEAKEQAALPLANADSPVERLMTKRAPVAPTPRAPWRIAEGERIYAIGDIHGRADLFEDLLSRIRADTQARGQAKTKIVLLGDVIDRGIQSAQLISRLRRYTAASDRIILLKGNHEQAMASALSGDMAMLRGWLGFGGDATLMSFGVPKVLITQGAPSALLQTARRQVTREVIRWLDDLPLFHRSGDVFFVHAGIRPGVPLNKQSPQDLLWITDEFLRSEALHPALIVHGHTVWEHGPEILPNRINVDTGAYKSGRLSAVGFEDDQTWTLRTG